MDPEELLDSEGGSDGDDDSKDSKQIGDDDGEKDKEGSDKGSEEHSETDNSKSKTSEDDEDSKEKPEEKSNLSQLAEELKARNDSLEDPLKDIDDEWEPKNYKELLQLSERIAEKKIEELSIKKEQEELDKIQESEKSRTEIEDQWKEEITRLIGDDRLPKIKDETNPEDEGVKARDNVFRFMIDHNKKVNETGKGYHITSFEHALDLSEKEELLKEKEAYDKRQIDINKKRGSIVGGNTGGGSGSVSKVGYVAGQSLDQILSDIVD